MRYRRSMAPCGLLLGLAITLGAPAGARAQARTGAWTQARTGARAQTSTGARVRTSAGALRPVRAEERGTASRGGHAGAAPDTAARPLPYPMSEPPDFRRAVARGTRTETGGPGPRYWTQYARYRIDARLAPSTNLVTGRERVTYLNRSPHTLARVAVYLRQNIYREGAPRTVPLPLTGGIEVRRVTADGAELPRVGGSAATGAATIGLRPGAASDSAPGWTVDGTVAWLRLPRPLAPGDSVQLGFRWSFHPAPAPADGREGQDGTIWFLGYWYPQLAVYDDVSGWVTDPYLGTGEFYMGYADYDVRLSVPAGYLVGATGTLADSDAVLPSSVIARLRRARSTCRVVHAVPADGRGAGRATLAAGREPSPGDPGAGGPGTGDLTWRFTATDVRDFAAATSAKYVWDATCALVGDSAHPDTVAIDNFYRPIPEASAWAGGARFNRNAVEFLSRYLWPYPYPQMTSVEGILDSGGMEYPMVTVIQAYADTARLQGNLMHEIGHMWFPMQVGSNEDRVPWQDEGLTQFNSGQGVREMYGYDREGPARTAYLSVAGTGREVSLMRWSDLYPSQELYFTLPYQKTTTLLVALRAILGPDVFLKAYRTYGERWRGKHPSPWDFFHTFDRVAGRDLSWFWRPWFFDTWTLDQALGPVRTEGDSTAIEVEDRGLAPMPVLLAVTRADGSVDHVRVPVGVWLAGARRHVVRVPSSPRVVKVEIDPDSVFPDIDRNNQVWTAPTAGEAVGISRGPRAGGAPKAGGEP